METKPSGWSVWIERSAKNWRCRWKGKYGTGQRTFVYKEDASECGTVRRRHFQRLSAGLPVGNFIGEIATEAKGQYRFDEFAHFAKAVRKNATKIFSEYRSSAKSRGLAFSLSEAEFAAMWGKPCFYCGASLAKIGLDRLSSAIGYIRGNIVSCCRKCNYMKHTMEAEDFISHCGQIASHYRGRAGLAPVGPAMGPN
jgi:hypothetical protein